MIKRGNKLWFDGAEFSVQGLVPDVNNAWAAIEELQWEVFGVVVSPEGKVILPEVERLRRENEEMRKTNNVLFRENRREFEVRERLAALIAAVEEFTSIFEKTYTSWGYSGYEKLKSALAKAKGE